jgi:hypothetical protein
VRALCLLSILVLVACGGGDDPTDLGGDGVTNFTAKIDGADWNAEFAPVASNPQPGMYVISAVRTTGSVYTFAITLHNITGPGTYPLGVNLQVFGGQVVLSDAGSGWSTTLDGEAGEIDITTLTATRIVATFEFVADQLMNTTSTRTVTQGQLDIPITGTGGVAAANRGSSFAGTVGGAAYTSAQVVHSLTGATPVLTVVGNNTVRSVTFTLTNMTGPGTYTLSGSPFRVVTSGGAPGNVNAVWSSNLTGGFGSVTIASVTADRIQGTVNATLAAAGGGASGTLTVAGAFSLGRGGP